VDARPPVLTVRRILIVGGGLLIGILVAFFALLSYLAFGGI